jgi:hypothetical protein
MLFSSFLVVIFNLITVGLYRKEVVSETLCLKYRPTTLKHKVHENSNHPSEHIPICYVESYVFLVLKMKDNLPNILLIHFFLLGTNILPPINPLFTGTRFVKRFWPRTAIKLQWQKINIIFSTNSNWQCCFSIVLRDRKSKRVKIIIGMEKS